MKRNIHKIIGAVMATLPYFVFRSFSLSQYLRSMSPIIDGLGWMLYVPFFVCFSFVGTGLALIACDGPLKVSIKKPELIIGGALFLYCAVQNVRAVIIGADPFALIRWDFLGMLSAMSQLDNSMRAVLYTGASYLTVYGLFGGKREN